MSIGKERYAQHPRSHTQVRPYAVEENDDQVNVISIALTASDISILSRVNADVTNIPDVKYAN